MPHIDLDTLADHAEGLLSADRATSVTAHLDSCAECRMQLADLNDLSRMLAATPAPPLPAGVAARIDSALAREAEEAARRPADPAYQPDYGIGKVVPISRAQRRNRWMRGLVAAAAAAVLIGGGATVAAQFVNQDPPAAVGEVPTVDVAQLDVITSGTEYSPNLLQSQLTGVLQQMRDDAVPVGDTEAIRSDLDACLPAAVERQGSEPAVVDVAQFEGQPAFAVFFPSADDQYDVVITSRQCTGGDGDVLDVVHLPDIP